MKDVTKAKKWLGDHRWPIAVSLCIVLFVAFWIALPIDEPLSENPLWSHPLIQHPEAIFPFSFTFTANGTTKAIDIGGWEVTVSGAGGISVDNQLKETVILRPSSGLALFLNQWPSNDTFITFSPAGAHVSPLTSDRFPALANISLSKEASTGDWIGSANVMYFESGTWGGNFNVTTTVPHFGTNHIAFVKIPPFIQISSEEVTVSAWNDQLVTSLTLLIAIFFVWPLRKKNS
jgi:hypothetical protein